MRSNPTLADVAPVPDAETVRKILGILGSVDEADAA